MTGRELLSQILDLGGKSQFNSTFEARAVYTAINRAIDEVNKLFPITRSLQLLNYPTRPVEYYPDIKVHRGGVATVFHASGIRSLAFAISGTGKAVLSADDTDLVCNFTWTDEPAFKIISGIVEDLIGSTSGNVTLSFEGEYSYMIKDLSFYDELVSPIASDITTYSQWVKYDLASEKYVGGRFLAFDSAPAKCDGKNVNTPNDYKIEGSAIYIRAERPGVYEIRYRARPAMVDADNLDLPLDLDEEVHNVVAPRAAYYLYYMVDEDVADRCNLEYQRLYAQYMSIRKVKTLPKFQDVRGW